MPPAPVTPRSASPRGSSRTPGPARPRPASGPSAAAAEAEQGARLVRQSAAEDVERMHREAHEYHAAARAEIMKASEEARQRADTVRAEAQAAVERARAEVHTLAARRDAITAQLGNLSGVIDALAVTDAAHHPPQSPSTPDQESMNQPEFPTVFRGYDPVQVDQHVAALQQAADAARQEAAASSVELTKLRQSHEALGQELEGQRRSLDRARGRRPARCPARPSPTSASGSARCSAWPTRRPPRIRSAAAAEVEQARRAADEDAALVRAEADRYAEEVRSRADVDASEAVSRAKREADSIIDDAAREAAARREEAEAYYEKQRATAAASAADFERTLGERREKSAAEFTAQMAQQDQALAAVQERADLLGREAEEDRQTAAAEASRTLEAARAEAAALVGSAKEQAERIRRDSERELAAATARRDSITAQLSNVRNMLATLGGTPGVGPFGAEPEQAAPVAAEVHGDPQGSQSDEAGDVDPQASEADEPAGDDNPQQELEAPTPVEAQDQEQDAPDPTPTPTPTPTPSPPRSSRPTRTPRSGSTPPAEAPAATRWPRRAQLAEGAADAAQQVRRVDAQLVELGPVVVGVDLLRQLPLRVVRGVVLADAAQQLDDLLPVDLHVVLSSSSSVAVGSAEPVDPSVKRIPASPPRIAPKRLTAATAAAASRPAVLRSPHPTGRIDPASSPDGRSTRSPAPSPSPPTTTARTTAHSHTARPCRAPSKRAIRPAT